MSVSDRVLRSVDWQSVQVLRGSGPELAEALSRFIGCDNPDEMADLWWGLEGVMFAQGTIYGAAEPAVDVLLAALVDGRPEAATAWIVELLRMVLVGVSPDDPSLQLRCRARAARGTWLLATLAIRLDGTDREAVLEVLGLIDQAVADSVRSALT